MLYCSGDRVRAGRDLDAFLEQANKERISHGDYATACAFRGMLYEEEGANLAAQEVWSRGTWRAWHEPPVRMDRLAGLRGLESVELDTSISYNGILVSWTNVLTVAEAEQIKKILFQGFGIVTGTIKRLLDVTFPPEFQRELIVNMWRTPRGKEMAKRYILREFTLRESIIKPGCLILYQGILTGALRGRPITQDIDEDLFSNCEKIVDDFDSGQFGDDEVIEIMHLWRGRYRQTAWEGLSKKLDPERVGGLAYVIGMKSLADGEMKSARTLLQKVVENESSPDSARQDAQRELDKLKSSDDVPPDGASPGPP
jgi:hypothetical protein